MTYKEAAADFKKSIEAIESNMDSFYEEYKQNMVESKEQFKLAIEALEKQIAKKPIKTPYFYGQTYVCPACQGLLIYNYGNFAKCCPNCGQSIDWSDTE